MPPRTLRKPLPCRATQTKRPDNSSWPDALQSKTDFGVKFPKYKKTSTETSPQPADWGLLSDLPEDGLSYVEPHIPMVVVNIDDLTGIQDPEAYRRKMMELNHKVQQHLLQRAEKDGYGPMVFSRSNIHALRDKDSGRWPMFLASLLVREPDKSVLTNEALLREVAEEMDVRPFAKSYMSKPLTKRQREAVAGILRSHGIPVEARQFKTGTDIRKLVRAHTRQGETSAPVNVHIQVTARPGSINIAGKEHKLHPRRGKPKGDPLQDLELNIEKTRLPLGVALKLLGVKDRQATGLLSYLPG